MVAEDTKGKSLSVPIKYIYPDGVTIVQKKATTTRPSLSITPCVVPSRELQDGNGSQHGSKEHLHTTERILVHIDHISATF